MKQSLLTILCFMAYCGFSFSAAKEPSLKVNSSQFHISSEGTKVTLENVGPVTARGILKSLWNLNRGEVIIVHNEYFLNHDEFVKKVPKELLRKINFNADDSDVKVAKLTLKFNEQNKNYELYTNEENYLILKSAKIDVVLNRVFEIQYPKGYEKRRIKEPKTK